MHFDDRLATVLRLRAQGTALARIQYRQLLDLLGTQPSDARSDRPPISGWQNCPP
jgi:two-component system, OmpR family, sensor kinase